MDFDAVNHVYCWLRVITRSTYRSEKLLNISGVRVHDQFVNFLLSDFSQNLSI